VCNYELGKGEANCEAVSIPKCPPGYVPIQINVGECIPAYDCVCNMSRNPCPEKPTCDELYHLDTTETECCPLYECGKHHHMCDLQCAKASCLVYQVGLMHA